MQAMRKKLAALKPLRFVMIAFTCAVLLFSYAVPAFAATSKPTDGEAQLKSIESKSIDVLEAGGPYSLEKTQYEANKGLNEVQGDADIDKMKRPENSQSAPPAVEQVVQKNLEKLQGK